MSCVSFASPATRSSLRNDMAQQLILVSMIAADAAGNQDELLLARCAPAHPNRPAKASRWLTSETQRRPGSCLLTQGG
jgi:hypothetical protein